MLFYNYGTIVGLLVFVIKLLLVRCECEIDFVMLVGDISSRPIGSLIYRVWSYVLDEIIYHKRISKHIRLCNGCILTRYA